MGKIAVARRKVEHGERRHGRECTRCHGSGRVERAPECIQRGRPPIGFSTSQECPVCKGKGSL